MTTKTAPSARGTQAALIAVVVIWMALVGWATPARAGGWAVSTLDELPSPLVGTPVTVGFTIRQHGATPVALDNVGIEITTSGSTRFFPATSDDVVGHYTATVTFPSVGEHTWAIRQGWFAPQSLGPIAVHPSDAGPRILAATRPDVSDTQPNRWLPYALTIGALLLAAAALLDATIGRRHRHLVA
jgi:hypothetical protein